MAELLDVGKQCQECNRLDYLPFTCNDCGHYFCQFHYRIEHHSCLKPYAKSRIVSRSFSHTPVPSVPREACDLVIGNHSNVCASKDNRIYKYACSKPGCTKRELVSVKCLECKQEYCVKHRHTMDHICEKKHITNSTREQARVSQATLRQHVNSNYKENQRDRKLKNKRPDCCIG